MHHYKGITFLAGLLILVPAIHAQVPQLLNCQGRVSVNGTNFTGTGQFKFALMNNSSSISRTASGVATISGGFLTIVTVTDGGTGYVLAPAVTASGGGGSNAVITSSISSGGVVTNATVNNPGSGYVSIPAIQFAAPPTAYASLWSNDGTSANGSQPSAAVTLAVTNGLYSVLLGDTTLGNMAALSATVFTNTDVRLRIWFNNGVNGFQQLSPDQRIAAVGYALMAGSVPDGSITASKIAAGAVGTSQLAPGAGGTMVTQLPATTNVQTVANSFYILTNNAFPSALTLPANPSVGDKIKIAGNALGFTLSANNGQAINGLANAVYTGSTVVDTNYDIYDDFFYGLLACSADGSKVYLTGDYGGSVYFSSNNINQFSASQLDLTGTNTFDGYWTGVASSANGNKLAAITSGGSIYTSTNSGLNWNRQTNPSTAAWVSIASSADGSKLAAMIYGGGIYTSVNSGMDWFLQTNAPAAAWQSVASSTNGSKLAAVANWDGTLGGIYTSVNSGTNWTLQTSAPTNAIWQSIASSADGSKLAAVQQGSVYTSVDSGTNWVLQTNVPSANWSSVASSTDGSKLVAVQNVGAIFGSSNSGVNWTMGNVIFQGLIPFYPSDFCPIVCTTNGQRVYFTGSSYFNGGNVSGVVFCSTNYGYSFINLTKSPSIDYLTCSSDGRKLAGYRDGSVYTSTNYGANWILKTNFAAHGGIASSADGTKLIASSENEYLCFISTDSGDTWKGIGSDYYLPANNGTSCSADGSKILLNKSISSEYSSNSRRQLLLSADSGATWSTSQPGVSLYGTAFVCSSDGNRLVAAENNPDGYMSIYTSPDFGGSWFKSTSIQTFIRNNPGGYYYFPNVVSSADGTKVLSLFNGIIYSYRVYKYSAFSGNAFSTCELVYTDNGQWQISSSTGSFFGL